MKERFKFDGLRFMVLTLAVGITTVLLWVMGGMLVLFGWLQYHDPALANAQNLPRVMVVTVLLFVFLWIIGNRLKRLL